MAVCKGVEQHSNALITAQNHGTILIMVAWFLACLLAFCAAARLIGRFRRQRLRHLPLLDDAVVVAASLCGIGATVVISTAVDSGLGKRKCLLSPVDIEDVQLKVFITTILVVFALSISKCSILLFLHQLADNALQRLGVMIISIVVLIWTLAVMAGIVFECELPKPWALWTGKCIPLLPFWFAATMVDIIIDTTLLILSFHIVWTTQVNYHRKTFVTVLFSTRLILIGLSSVRLFFLNRAFGDAADPTFDYIPYAATTQAHSAMSIVLACSLMLKPFANFFQASKMPTLPTSRRNSRHYSGTTIGGTPYESFESFGSPEIAKEPLHRIQRSMSGPASSTGSRLSSSSDILLPEVLLPPTRFTKAPPRPPPPTDAERPDLSMFYKTSTVREPPKVTRLGSVREKTTSKPWERIGSDQSLKARGLS